MTSFERYERFLALHQAPGLFVMPNAWDGMSALLLREAGFQALGSSSIAIAFALGRPDGAHAVNREAAVASAALLSNVSGLPVNGDLEDGFGPDPEDCARTVEAAIAAGLAGLGIEEQRPTRRGRSTTSIVRWRGCAGRPRPHAAASCSPAAPTTI